MVAGSRCCSIDPSGHKMVGAAVQHLARSSSDGVNWQLTFPQPCKQLRGCTVLEPKANQHVKHAHSDNVNMLILRSCDVCHDHRQ